MSRKGLLFFTGYVFAISGLMLLFFNAYMYMFIKSDSARMGGTGLFLCLIGVLMIRYARNSKISN